MKRSYEAVHLCQNKLGCERWKWAKACISIELIDSMYQIMAAMRLSLQDVHMCHLLKWLRLLQFSSKWEKLSQLFSVNKWTRQKTKKNPQPLFLSRSQSQPWLWFSKSITASFENHLDFSNKGWGAKNYSVISTCILALNFQCKR